MQKTKLLEVLRYFEAYTDEEHDVTVEQLISHLESLGISAERKSVYSDIETLMSYGADIVKQRHGRITGYYLACRDFETAELKMLVDIVEASRFVTAKKSEQLISKIKKLCSIHDAKKLSPRVYMSDRVKAPSEVIYLNVDKIHSALADFSSISFMYFHYNWKKEKEYRRNGDLHRVVPLSLMWNNDNYYLVAHDKLSDGIRHFRVDKMERVALDQKLSDGERAILENFDPAAYSKSVFDMYAGKLNRIELRVPEGLVGNMFDRFGMDIVLRKDGDGFVFSAEVALSPSFFAWLSTFEGDVKIVSPESAVAAFASHIEKIKNSL